MDISPGPGLGGVIVQIVASSATMPGRMAEAELLFPAVADDLRAWADSLAAVKYDATQREARLTQAAVAAMLLLAGCKLIGFVIWQRPGRPPTVTFPGRSYVMNGNRRVYTLFRPYQDHAGQARVAAAILEAYAVWRQHPPDAGARGWSGSDSHLT